VRRALAGFIEVFLEDHSLDDSDTSGNENPHGGAERPEAVPEERAGEAAAGDPGPAAPNPHSSPAPGPGLECILEDADQVARVGFHPIQQRYRGRRWTRATLYSSDPSWHPPAQFLPSRRPDLVRPSQQWTKTDTWCLPAKRFPQELRDIQMAFFNTLLESQVKAPLRGS
jgi:hypothetical protein